MDNTDGDTESAHSDSLMETSRGSATAPDITPSEFHSFNVDIKPSDSVSHVNTPPQASSFKMTSSMTVDEIPFIFQIQITRN